jgi:hypothetical protein
MPGPQTQHKGTVYGDDENAPKPGLGPPVRRRPQNAHRYLLRGVINKEGMGGTPASRAKVTNAQRAVSAPKLVVAFRPHDGSLHR